jgi:hypothetical protein
MITKIKKSVTKKSTAKGSGKRALVCANSEQCFWTTDGKVLKNLVELRDSLAHMTDKVFAHHVTKNKNDFADWINHVLQDGELAVSLRSAKTPKTAHALVLRRLKVYAV